MQITWTNCADAMPPYNRKYLILKLESGNKLFLKIMVSDELKEMDVTGWQWTEYTPEKWKGLVKKRYYKSCLVAHSLKESTN